MKQLTGTTRATQGQNTAPAAQDQLRYLSTAEIEQLTQMVQWKMEQERQLAERAQVQAPMPTAYGRPTTAELLDDGLAEAMRNVRPGQRVKVERFEGFEVRYEQSSSDGLKIIAVLAIGAFVALVAIFV